MRDALKVSLDIVALAKERSASGEGEDAIVFPSGQELTNFIKRIRDEAHRFVITFHRTTRGKRAVRSVLDEISGLGPERRRSLLKAFGSAEAISWAPKSPFDVPESFARVETMKCPACEKQLKAISAGDVTVDSCTSGCGGVWFDRRELDKFDEAHEFDGHEILSAAKNCEAVKVDRTKLKNCPVCSAEVLVRQFIDPQHGIEIDQCWECGGVWLDMGEINSLRAQYSSMAERAKAVNSYVDSNLKAVKENMSAEVNAQLSRYNEATSTRFKSAVYAFKKLLGLDDLQDGL